MKKPLKYALWGVIGAAGAFILALIIYAVKVLFMLAEGIY